MRPKSLFQRLEQVIGVAGRPRRLREAIETEICEHWALPPIQAAEKAEQMEEAVRKLVISSGQQSDRTGCLSVLSLSSLSELVVQGSCFVEPTDSREIAGAKRRRLHIEPLLDQIRSLTFQQFEVFGAGVLRELGAKIVRVTPHSDDQGIDFYGLLSLGQNLDLPEPFGKLAHDVTLRFAGQAKHYPNNPIGPALMRELIGSIALARYKVFTTDKDLFDDLQLLPFNPLVSLFFTTGRFTRGALELADKAGVIARSGEQLAVFLADCGVGIEKTGGTSHFSRDEFLEWLNHSAESNTGAEHFSSTGHIEGYHTCGVA